MLIAQPTIVSRDEVVIKQVLYKVGALIFRRSQETNALQVALLRDNNSSSFINFKFRLQHLLHKYRNQSTSDYGSVVTKLLDWANGFDPVLQMRRARMWRSYEITTLKSLSLSALIA